MQLYDQIGVRIILLKSLLLLFTIIFQIKIATGQQVFLWPGNKKCAIVLTYDDGLLSQLQYAIPQLDSAKLKGTFFLTGNLNGKSIRLWRKAAGNGHEI